MITKQHTEEDLSKAYVLAVGAKAGLSVKFTDGHDYTIDGSLNEVSVVRGRYHESGISLDFQLKACQNCIEEDDSIIYDFDADTYNYLCERAKTKYASPVILLLLALPKDENDWIVATPEQLILKRACYWMSFTSDFSQNTSTKRIKIPKKNLFNIAAAKSLIDTVKQTGSVSL